MEPGTRVGSATTSTQPPETALPAAYRERDPSVPIFRSPGRQRGAHPSRRHPAPRESRNGIRESRRRLEYRLRNTADGDRLSSPRDRCGNRPGHGSSGRGRRGLNPLHRAGCRASRSRSRQKSKASPDTRTRSRRSGRSPRRPGVAPVTPGKEGQNRPGRPGLITEVQMVRIRVVEVHRPLHQPESERLGVEVDRPLRVARRWP